MNFDLTHEYGAAIQYSYSSSVVSGLYCSLLKPFFEAEITDELGPAIYLSEKIKSLGDAPTTKVADEMDHKKEVERLSLDNRFQ